MKKKSVYYCKQCDKWRGDTLICPECQVKCVKRELPKGRGGCYFLEGVDKPLVRVTGVISDVIAKPGLTFWIAKEAAKAALENPFISIDDAASASTKHRDKAGAQGTLVHKSIELMAEGGEICQEVADMPQIQAYWKFMADMPHDILSSETTVYSEEMGYAGTLDRVARFATGRVVLLDFKTSKNVYPETAIQMSAYLMGLEENKYEHKIDGIAVVHLKKDGTYSFVEMDPCPEVFKSVLAIYNWKKNV